MFEHRDGSAVRVMTAPWRANFLAGFRAIPGLVSLGTFFASKESTSATPKAFKLARRQGENDLARLTKPACETTHLLRFILLPQLRQGLGQPGAGIHSGVVAALHLVGLATDAAFARGDADKIFGSANFALAD